MNAASSTPDPTAPPHPTPDDPESVPVTPQDPEKGRVPPVTEPSRSEHPKQ